MPWQKQFDVDEVLGKAMQAFWSRGYEATSMQDLVACTGVNRASLYATYQDKHTLFLAALRMYDERQRRQRLQALEAGHGPRDSIRQLLLAFATCATDSCGNLGCFLTNTALELAAHDREAGRIVAAAQEEIEAFFARQLRRGQAIGEIGAEVDPDETAAGLLASLAGLAVLSRSRPEPKLMQAILAEADRRLG